MDFTFQGGDSLGGESFRDDPAGMGHCEGVEGGAVGVFAGAPIFRSASGYAEPGAGLFFRYGDGFPIRSLHLPVPGLSHLYIIDADSLPVEGKKGRFHVNSLAFFCNILF